MSDINKTIISGRLTADPELVPLANGKSVTHLRIASDSLARGDGAGFVNVSAFGPGGEAAHKVLAKGWEVLVDGRLEHQVYTKADGSRGESYGIVGDVQFLRAPRGAGREQEVGVEQSAEVDREGERRSASEPGSALVAASPARASGVGRDGDEIEF